MIYREQMTSCFFCDETIVYPIDKHAIRGYVYNIQTVWEKSLPVAVEEA